MEKILYFISKNVPEIAIRENIIYLCTTIYLETSSVCDYLPQFSRYKYGYKIKWYIDELVIIVEYMFDGNITLAHNKNTHLSVKRYKDNEKLMSDILNMIN